jgi:multiple sugar transport system substrate-binding protein
MRSRSRMLSVVAAAAAASVLVAVAGTIPAQSSGSRAGGTKTLRFWNYYGGAQLVWLKAQTKKFEAANPGVKVKLIQVVGSQQDQKLLASVSTGTGPDLLINNIVVDFPTLVNAGVMLDLTSRWKAYRDKSQFPASAVWRNKGKVYNLMSYTNLLGLYYNKDILASVGITTAPTTLDELEADMAKVKAGGQYQGLAESGAPTVEGAWLFAPQLLGKGVDYCNFTGAPVTDAFNRIERWSKNGYIPLATATWDQNAAWQQFSTGKYAFGLNGNWQLASAKTAAFKVGTAEFPASPAGKSVVYPGGEGIAIGAKSKYPDLAWKYLQSVFLSNQGGRTVFTTGSIPVRADVASIPAIKNDALVQPFVKAAHSTGHWPNNSKTADMQTALGKAASAVISGQQSAADGAHAAITDIASAKKSGGGSC